MQQVLDRLRGEFLEMPGLRLTAAQVQRFCGVEPSICQVILDQLVEANFLQRRSDGTYVRVGDLPTGRPVKATLHKDRRPARAS